MDLGSVLTPFEQIAKILALGLGGFWAYFNFIKGRVYKPRLEPRVIAELKSSKNHKYALVTLELKNVGLSNVTLEQRGTALRLLGLTEATFKDSGSEILWNNRLNTFPVFQSHAWIEPSETIRERLLIPIHDNDLIALKLELRIVSKGIEWNDALIIEATTTSAKTINGGEQL